MAINLAHDSSSDAQITDGIGRGDLSSAARLWVRHWPTALEASRLYVERDEVPGLAAEALIGTISLTATGRGPREDVASFVRDMVRELGEEDGYAPAAPGEPFPDVFVSPRLTSAFADLPASDQHRLRTAGAESDAFVAALTTLQTSYLMTHLGDVPTRDCRPAHIAMMAAADGSATTAFSGQHWLHLSTCAWCTEAFHEIAFANVALPALIAPEVWTAPVAPVVVAPVVAAPVAVVNEEPEEPEAPVIEPLVDPLDILLEDETPVLAHVESAEGVRSYEGETITFASITEDHVGDAVAAVPEVDEDEERRGGFLRSGRQRLLAAAVAAVLIGGVAFAVTRNDDSTSPAAATSKLPTTSPSIADPGPTAGDETDGVETPSVDPTELVDPPTQAPLDSGTTAPDKKPTATKTSKAPKPSSTPTKGPGTTPTTPATSNPPSDTPTPTPTATPTKHCSGLEHLLGMC